MKQELRASVWARAAGICEYCRLPDEYDPLPFCIDHIRPQYHHGRTVANNLALSCFNCNTFKGTNIAGIDPVTNQHSVLFNPREHNWDEHFAWDGPVLVGRTAIGRATVDVLRINLPDRVEHRRSLIAEDVFPVRDT
jgi:hypothetical protein